MNKLKVKVSFVHPEAKCPVYKTKKAAACDFYSPINTTILPGGSVVIPTGVRMQIEEGFYLRLESRSGLSAKFAIEKGAGIIDEDYRDEIGVILYNHGVNPFHIVAGDRVVQGIFQPYWQADFEVVGELEETGRGGFGSTGVRE